MANSNFCFMEPSGIYFYKYFHLYLVEFTYPEPEDTGAYCKCHCIIFTV